MTNQEILTKAIQKALINEYSPDGIDDVTSFKATIRDGQTWVRWFNNDGQEVIQDIEHVIYNHDFAKALWNSNEIHMVSKKMSDLFWHGEELLDWQYHLQQMVIADDPIKYLGEHLDD